MHSAARLDDLARDPAAIAGREKGDDGGDIPGSPIRPSAAARA